MTSAATATTSRDPFSADRGIEPVPFRKLGTMPEPDPSPTPDTIAEPLSPHPQPVTAAPDRNRPVPHAIALFRALPRRRQVMIAGTTVGSLLSLFLVMGIAKRQASPVVQEVGMISAPPPAGPKASPAPGHSPTSSPSSPVPQVSATDEDLKALLAMKKPPHPDGPIPATPSAETTPAQKHDTGIEKAVPTDDAVQRATRLQAAPMTSDDQLQVLQLVTEEAALVQRTRSDIAALRQDLDRLRIADTAKASDLTRRMSLLEAKRAVADAEAPPSDGPAATRAAADKARAALEAAAAEPQPAPMPPQSPASRTAKMRPTPPAPLPTWTPHYRILAASPQLAMVQDDAAPAGQPPQSEIEIGTDLRGYGRVRAISQRGTMWVIQTERGIIQ